MTLWDLFDRHPYVVLVPLTIACARIWWWLR